MLCAVRFTFNGSAVFKHKHLDPAAPGTHVVTFQHSGLCYFLFRVIEPKPQFPFVSDHYGVVSMRRLWRFTEEGTAPSCWHPFNWSRRQYLALDIQNIPDEYFKHRDHIWVNTRRCYHYHLFDFGLNVDRFASCWHNWHWECLSLYWCAPLCMNGNIKEYQICCGKFLRSFLNLIACCNWYWGLDVSDPCKMINALSQLPHDLVSTCIGYLCIQYSSFTVSVLSSNCGLFRFHDYRLFFIYADEPLRGFCCIGVGPAQVERTYEAMSCQPVHMHWLQCLLRPPLCTGSPDI